MDARRPKRRTGMVAALLSLSVLALPGTASATPTVTFQAEPVPIQGFSGTGNVLGAGAAISLAYTISGTEYAGTPPPLTELVVLLPAKTKIKPKGFAECSQETLEQSGAGACPQGSAAGPSGSAMAHLSFGGERVPEQLSWQPFFGAAGLNSLLSGVSPVDVNVVTSASYQKVSGKVYGQELKVDLPLLAAVPGAPYMSLTELEFTLGAARAGKKKPTYYTTLPKACPSGGWPFKAVLVFSASGTPEETVEKEFHSPCPH